ncbi:MAG TPA: hypothetical protein VGD64_03775, partial [Acidisarcina sp.]
ACNDGQKKDGGTEDSYTDFIRPEFFKRQAGADGPAYDTCFTHPHPQLQSCYVLASGWTWIAP